METSPVTPTVTGDVFMGKGKERGYSVFPHSIWLSLMPAGILYRASGFLLLYMKLMGSSNAMVSPQGSRGHRYRRLHDRP